MNTAQISFILYLVLFHVENLRGDGVTCRACWDVANPQHCRNSMTCGENEICSTEEFTDSMGLQAFRLSCENQAKCTLYLNAKNLFGKRELPAPVPSDKCYECCSNDGCNVNLCQRSVGRYTAPAAKSTTVAAHNTTTVAAYKTTTTAATYESTTVATTQGACPSKFVSFKDYCYLFGPSYTPTYGEVFCTSLGGHLLSIHSEEERNFLVQQMIAINDRHIGSFWTGGYYDDSRNELKWVDKTPFNYSHWFPGEPYLVHSSGDDLYVAIGNLMSNTQHSEASMWVHNGGYIGLHVICKRRRM